MVGGLVRYLEEDTVGVGPRLTDALVQRAEASLGYRLPKSYVNVLHEQNGGYLLRRCFRTIVPTPNAPNHIEVTKLLGIGYEGGIDGELGSAYMIGEWGYPDVGVVLFSTPSAGPESVMLDYSDCGPAGEPAVLYVDVDVDFELRLAPDFATFMSGLIDCAPLMEELEQEIAGAAKPRAKKPGRKRS